MRIKELVEALKSSGAEEDKLVDLFYDALETLDIYDIFEILEELYDEDELRDLFIEKINERKDELENLILSSDIFDEEEEEDYEEVYEIDEDIEEEIEETDDSEDMLLDFWEFI